MLSRLCVPLSIIMSLGSGCSSLINSPHITLDKANVESIIITSAKDSLISHRLNKKQIIRFVDSWNQGTAHGPRKSASTLIIKVKEKNGASRSFKANNNLIKEGNNQAFSMLDSTLMDDLEQEMSRFTITNWHEVFPPPRLINYWAERYNRSDYPLKRVVINTKHPEEWIKKEHMDELISMLDSKEKSGGLMNVLSSVMSDKDWYSEKGGLAALFIQAYRYNKEYLFSGFASTPKVDSTLNQELISWWNLEKNK